MKHLQMKGLGRLLLFTAILLFTGGVKAQQKKLENAYTIAAAIEELPDNTVFHLIKVVNGKSDTIAKTISKNGKFSFTGKSVLEAEIHFVIKDTAGAKKDQGKNWVSLLLDKPGIQLKGRQWPDVIVSGSAATDVYNNYHKRLAGFASSFNKLTDVADSAKRGLIEEDYRKFALQYINTHVNSYAAPFLIINNKTLSLEQKDAFYKKMPEIIKGSFYGIQLKNALVIEKLRSQVAIGKRLPDFKLTTPEGKVTTLLELASKAEYTLVDFWASWCKPCREAIPKMKIVYDKYHAKGFNVLGISTDANLAAWKKALAQDGAKWNQGIDNIERAEKSIFDIGAIPAYLLIDKNGNLIEASFMSRSLSLAGSGRFGNKTLEGDLDGILAQLFEGK